jgi:hypothetical protein
MERFVHFQRRRCFVRGLKVLLLLGEKGNVIQTGSSYVTCAGGVQDANRALCISVEQAQSAAELTLLLVFYVEFAVDITESLRNCASKWTNENQVISGQKAP